jgi:hypothetical protein
MAFPWTILSKADLATGEIVEDLALTVKMIEAGAPPLLDLGAVVTSELPKTERGAATQRARWELGSLAMALRAAPRLFLRGLEGEARSLALALDIAVPPLTALSGAIILVIALATPAALLGAPTALKIALFALALLAVSVAIAWTAYGRKTLPPRALLAIIPYVLSKTRVYGAEGRRSARRWTRTERGDEE